MSKLHVRAIGNTNCKPVALDKKKTKILPSGTPGADAGEPNSQCRVDPRAGIGGNYKTRRHYPAGQGKGFCAWRHGDKKLKRLPCARKPSPCGKCFTHGGKPSEYKPKKKAVTK